MRWYRKTKVVVVLTVLLSGMAGCSYYSNRGHGDYGHRGHEDVYVHEDGPRHYHY